MKWEECDKRRSWPTLRHYLGSSRKELRETTKNARMVVETTNMRTASTLALELTECHIYVYWSLECCYLLLAAGSSSCLTYTVAVYVKCLVFQSTVEHVVASAGVPRTALRSESGQLRGLREQL